MVVIFIPSWVASKLLIKRMYFSFCGGAVLGFELSASCLLGRCSTAWAIPSALFALVCLETGSYFLPRQAWTLILLFYTSHCSWDDRHTPPSCYWLRWDLRNFSLCWPWTEILLISASLVATVTAVNHWHPVCKLSQGNTLIWRLIPCIYNFSVR
jgi:hypothetical protein